MAHAMLPIAIVLASTLLATLAPSAAATQLACASTLGGTNLWTEACIEFGPDSRWHETCYRIRMTAVSSTDLTGVCLNSWEGACDLWIFVDAAGIAQCVPHPILHGVAELHYAVISTIDGLFPRG